MEFRIEYFENKSGKSQIKEYIDGLNKKDIAKILATFDLLKENQGYLEQPFSKHIRGKIRELIVKRHRIFYAVSGNKIIILLSCYFKQTQKTPDAEIERAERNLKEFLNRGKL